MLFSCSACTKKQSVSHLSVDDGAYFSIKEFAKDQFNTYWGQPFTLQKMVVLNGRQDSSYVSAYTLDWASILKVFFDADISDKKYLDQYSFSTFDDNATASRTYYYEAKAKDLFTRNLQIVTDPFTNKIKSVFIETGKKGRFGQKTQKLLYIPVKIIQVQEFESSFFGKDKNLRVDYRFMN